MEVLKNTKKKPGLKNNASIHIGVFVTCLVCLFSVNSVLTSLWGTCRTIEFSTFQNGIEVYSSLDETEYFGDMAETVKITGWAFAETEDANPDKSIQVLLVSDEQCYSPLTTQVERPDVTEAFKEKYSIQGTAHGFLAEVSTVSLDSGEYEIYVYCYENESARGLVHLGEKMTKNGRELTFEASSPYLGKKTHINLAEIKRGEIPPHFNIDICRVTDSVLSLQGWLYLDGQNCSEQKVYISFDDSESGYVTKQVSRPDVAAAFGSEGYTMSGFEASIPVEEIIDGSLTARILVEINGALYAAEDKLLTTEENGVLYLGGMEIPSNQAMQPEPDSNPLVKDENNFSITKTISAPLIVLMQFCYELLDNFVLAIFFFTLLTKIILLPINLWVHRSGIRMVEMMPEINQLKVRYFGDKETIADETQALYKRKKYHPIASTLPMIIQIVLLMGVIEAVKALLGSSDHILNQIPIEAKGLTLLMPVGAGLAALALTLSQNAWNPLQKEQSKAEQLSTGAVSVGISLFLGAFVSLGTGVYWIASNLCSIPYQLLLNAMINPKKYVDYQALEESRKELEGLTALGNEISKEDKLREKEDYKRFFSVANKHLVFYSEKSGFYKYYEDLIGELLRRSNVFIHYVTSDPDDQIFKLAENEKRIRPYYIGEKKLITLFMKMDADIVVMTTPDLETFHLKRSYVRKDIEYIFVNHGLGSINTEYRNGALDHFDTIFLNNDQDKREIRAWEKVKQQPEKRLVEYGYPLMDHLLDDYDAMMKNNGGVKNAQPRIVIAPSWQPDNIMDSCVDQLLSGLVGKGYKIVVRPHPQYVRHHANDLQKLQTKYQQYQSEVSFDTTFASFEDIYCSDLLITDWSGVGFEFSFTTCRPTLFIHTPMKILNPEYQLIQVESFQERMRSRIGQDLPLEQAEKIGETVADLLQNAPQYAEVIDQIRREERYNFRGAAKVGALDILYRLVERQTK